MRFNEQEDVIGFNVCAPVSTPSSAPNRVTLAKSLCLMEDLYEPDSLAGYANTLYNDDTNVHCMPCRTQQDDDIQAPTDGQTPIILGSAHMVTTNGITRGAGRTANNQDRTAQANTESGGDRSI